MPQRDERRMSNASNGRRESTDSRRGSTDRRRSSDRRGSRSSTGSNDPRRLSADVVHMNDFDWRHRDSDNDGDVHLDVNNSADEEENGPAEDEINDDAELEEEDAIFVAEERERVIEEMLAHIIKRSSVFLMGYSWIILITAIILQFVFDYSRRLSTNFGGMSVPTAMYVKFVFGLLASSVGLYMHRYGIGPDPAYLTMYGSLRGLDAIFGVWAALAVILNYGSIPYQSYTLSMSELILYFILLVLTLMSALSAPCHCRRLNRVWHMYQDVIDEEFTARDAFKLVKTKVTNKVPFLMSLSLAMSSKKTQEHLLGMVEQNEALKATEEAQQQQLTQQQEQQLYINQGNAIQQLHAAQFQQHNQLPPLQAPPNFNIGALPLNLQGLNSSHSALSMFSQHQPHQQQHNSLLHANSAHSFMSMPQNQLQHQYSMQSARSTMSMTSQQQLQMLTPMQAQYDPYGGTSVISPNNNSANPWPNWGGQSPQSPSARSQNSGMYPAMTPYGTPWTTTFPSDSFNGSLPGTARQPHSYEPRYVPTFDAGAKVEPAEFRARWTSLPKTGAFCLKYEKNPGYEGITRHMCFRGFRFMASGLIDEESTMKLYFFAQSSGVAFLLEMAVNESKNVATCTFKCQDHDMAEIFVKQFALHQLFGKTEIVVRRRNKQVQSQAQHQLPVDALGNPQMQQHSPPQPQQVAYPQQ